MSSSPSSTASPGTNAAAPKTPKTPSSPKNAHGNSKSSLFAPAQDQHISPTSTLSESLSNNVFRIPPSSFPKVLPMANSTRLVRSDSTVLTCFDPADKELYSLWVPKLN